MNVTVNGKVYRCESELDVWFLYLQVIGVKRDDL